VVPRETSTYQVHVRNKNTDIHSYPKRGSNPQPNLRALDNGRRPRTCGHCGRHAVPQKALYLPLNKAYDVQGRHVVPPSFSRGTRRR